MKAWVLSAEDEPYCSLVFANTRNEAKKLSNCYTRLYEADLGDVEWIDLRVRRCKELDSWENKSEKEIVTKLVQDCGWWFELEEENLRIDEDNIEELERLWR